MWWDKSTHIGEFLILIFNLSDVRIISREVMYSVYINPVETSPTYVGEIKSLKIL